MKEFIAMYCPANSVIITANRPTWGTFIDRLTAIGRTDTANFITQQVGCWTITTHPSITLDSERRQLWSRLMEPPDCPHCNGWGAVNGQPCAACGGSGNGEELLPAA